MEVKSKSFSVSLACCRLVGFVDVGKLRSSMRRRSDSGGGL